MIDLNLRPQVERFRWEAYTRTTGTKLMEDANSLGSFTQLNPFDICKLVLVDNQPGTHGLVLEFAHDVPVGAEAVFVRRRRVNLGMGHLPGWTIIGHRWPDKTRPGEFFFFEDWSDNMFYSTNFNAV